MTDMLSTDVVIDHLRLVLGPEMVTLDTFKPEATISLRLLLRSLGHTDDPDPDGMEWTQADLAREYTTDGDTLPLPHVLMVLLHITGRRVKPELRAAQDAFARTVCRLPFMQQAAARLFGFPEG